MSTPEYDPSRDETFHAPISGFGVGTVPGTVVELAGDPGTEMNSSKQTNDVTTAMPSPPDADEKSTHLAPPYPRMLSIGGVQKKKKMIRLCRRREEHWVRLNRNATFAARHSARLRSRHYALFRVGRRVLAREERAGNVGRGRGCGHGATDLAGVGL